MTVEQEYENLLRQVESRSWGKCDLLSGEQIDAVTIKNDTTAVLVFSRKVTNKPHIRTVILDRSGLYARWSMRTENTFNLPAERPSDYKHVVTTSNTPATVRTVTPSVELSGSDVDALLTFVQRVREDKFTGPFVNQLVACVEDVLS